MSTRAAPGPQLSSGRLRVDAARAIAKLREYQLVDRTAWVLEAIRAGVASGASQLELASDSNDIWLAWDGPAWPADDLPTLFDELVSPEPSEERQHLRLLAAAINSALGTDPAYVDIYTISPEGSKRARYTPEVLVETADLEDSPLRRIATESASAPRDHAPETGMLLHVRRRTALGMLTYLFWEREQPELATARAACRDLAVPITIGGTRYCRTDLGYDLVRMPLGADLDGFVALRDPDAPRPAFPEAMLEIAEHGVLLATYALPFAPDGSTTELELRGPIPIRVFVDARRMPTNASRSQVRREVPPISTAEQRGPAQAAKLIQALVQELGEPGCDERKRAAACALVAAVIAGPAWSSECFSHQAKLFGTSKLLRDAAGIPRPLRHAWTGHVYTGKDHLDPALGPWVSSIAWIPRGDPAAKIAARSAYSPIETKARIKWAKQQYRAHRKFFAHAKRPAALVVKRQPRVRLTLGSKLPGSCVPSSRFEGITGELGVSFDRADGELLLLFQGRPLERITLASPIGFDAVVDALELTPGDKFKSVARDVLFRCVELALQAALVCAAEVIAHELGEWPDLVLPTGITVGARSTYEVEARAVRIGLITAEELRLPRTALLASAPVWPTSDGRWISFEEVARHDVVGFTTGIHRFVPPAGRLILTGGKEQLAKLRSVRVIDYDKGRTSDDGRADRPARLAAALASTHGFALAIAGDDVCGAIAPATRAVIQLHHLGCALDSRPLGRSITTCALVADSDAIVPDAEWKTAAEPAGVHERDYAAWELALVHATLAALAGERPLELHGPEVRIESTLARWALEAIGRRHAQLPLDPAVVARFARAPILHVLGEREPISLEALVRRSPGTLYHVARSAAPVEGFTPLVADPELAVGLAVLAGASCVDATAELEVRRKAARRDARLAAHRANPARELRYPFANEPHVELPRSTKLSLAGLVGVGRHRLEIEVRIEQRTFATLTRQHELPLYAVVDLHISHANDDFVGLSEQVSAQLVELVRAGAAPLLLSIARSSPTLLGDLGPPRALLRAALGAAGVLSPEARNELRSAPAFSTIQGGRSSIAIASAPNSVLRIADWQSDWLGPADGEPPAAVDQAVLRVPEDRGELGDVVRQLAWSVADVSDDVTRLQSRRRMARGLVPKPALPHIPTELKRKLVELGDIGQRLGHGEIGLVDQDSSALVHDHGVPRQRLRLDVVPGIQIAIEAPELLDARVSAPLVREVDTAGSVVDQLARLRDLASQTASTGPASLATDAQALAERLLASVLATSGEGLDPRYKRRIARAVLAKRISPELVKRRPMFELVDGRWVDLDTLDAQIARFGNAWAVTGPTRYRPLDDDRLVFLLSSADLAAAYGSYAVIDATSELQLDDRARRNRDRPKATSLQLAGRDYLLAECELDGDGVTRPRGVVAPLLPHAAGQRGLFAHKEMTPFELMSDPCRWPTIAMVDDARLEPDRSWERPRTGTKSWSEVAARVSAASERALAQLVPRIDGACAQVLVGGSASLGERASRAKVQIRGAVWLVGGPRGPSKPIEVVDAYGRHAYVPRRGLAIGGTLYVHAPEGWERDATLDQAIPRLYGQLLRQLIGRRNLPQDLVTAHLATGIALEVVATADLGSLEFPCFHPEALLAPQLARLFAGSDPVPVVQLGETRLPPATIAVIEDGSELSQVVIACLGSRATRGWLPKLPRLATVPKPAPPPAETIVPSIPAVREPPRAATVVPIAIPPKPKPEPEPEPEPEPKPKPKPKPKRIDPPEQLHPIQNVVDAVARRLIELGAPSFGLVVSDFETPIVKFDRKLRFAGGNARLHAVANAIRAGSPWAQDAIDALTAHAITVLDEGRSEVNAQTVQDVLIGMLAER